MRIFIYECFCAHDLGMPSSLQSEGLAMLSALVRDAQRLPDVETVTLLHKNFQWPLGQVCERTTGTNEIERFRAISESCDWTWVIGPESDDWLERRSRTVLESGGHLLGSLPPAIRLTGDKLATADFWMAGQVPHPRTVPFDPANFTSIPGPWVMKPRFGAGSQATYLVCNRAEASRVWSRHHECGFDDFIMQECVRGQAASVALLMSETQTLPLLPARQHLSDDGRFRYLGGSLPLPEPLASRAVPLALQAVAGIDGLRGYVGVDLILGDDGVDYAIEINPRLTTSYLGLRQLCQQNIAELMLRMAQGVTIALPTWHAGEVHFET